MTETETDKSDLYCRKVQTGSFVVINHHLQKMLEQLGIWDENTKNQIIMNGGSIQSITKIPQPIKQLFKTSFER